MSLIDGLAFFGTLGGVAEGANLYIKSIKRSRSDKPPRGASGLIRTNRAPQPGWERNPPPEVPKLTAEELTRYEPIYNTMPATPGESPLHWLDRHSTASHGQPNHSHVYGICLAEDK